MAYRAPTATSKRPAMVGGRCEVVAVGCDCGCGVVFVVVYVVVVVVVYVVVVCSLL